MAKTSESESFLDRIVDLEYEIKKLNKDLRYQKKSSRYSQDTIDAIQSMIDHKKKRIAQLENDLLILIQNKQKPLCQKLKENSSSSRNSTK